MYYIEKDDKIALYSENLKELENSIAVMPWFQGLEIKEVQEGYTIVDYELVTLEQAEEKEQEKERERINQLSLTKREVFLAVYKDKGITPEQIRSQITNEEALIEFDYANDYFRGNPLINSIGEALGYTTEDLDYLFENGELPEKEEEPEEEN